MDVLTEIVSAFVRLGLVAFGGPIAHLGYFRHEFVERRRWLDDLTFADLVALCQFLPGPASSQVAFAIGRERGGLAGGFAASIAFLLPSAAIMVALGSGVSKFGDLRHAGWLHGLQLTTVAVVAQAVWSMARGLWPTWATRVLGLATAVALTSWPTTWMPIAAIATGGAIGWLAFRRPADDARPAPIRTAPHGSAIAAVLVYAALLIALPLAHAARPASRPLALFDSVYRAGALVFGGGHVVLPLLHNAVVRPGWIGEDTFLAGYGATQALPGPLFTFAGYLGASIVAGPRAWLGGAWCVLAIFLPGWLLIVAAQPYWRTIRATAWAPAALAGANAAVVGVLLAAFYSPIAVSVVATPVDVLLVIGAFMALVVARVPAWVIVGAMVAAGAL